MIGRKIGHYRITGKLGEGGMGVVWLAEDMDLERLVALKSLPIDTAGDKEQRARFIQEGRAAAHINHPNVAQVHEIAQVEGELLIVMEYVDSGSIKDRLTEAGGEPLPLDNALDWARQAAEGLAEAQIRGIIHRDIKPDNLMLDARGWLKITDFGVARLVVDGSDLATDDTVGTLGYQSPEQIRGEQVDYRSDLFSLGATLYEMFTGTRPFQGSNIHEMFSSILSTIPEVPSRLRPEFPSELDDVILKLLQKNLDDRYQSAGEVVVDIIDIQMNLGFLSTVDLPRRKEAVGEAASRLLARKKVLRQRTILTGTITAFAIALLTYGLLQGVFGGFENRLYDSRVRFAMSLTEPLDPDTGTFLIRIDSRALQKYGRFQQWPRSRHGDLAMRLSGWGARAVFFDLLFPEDDLTPRMDQRLSEALALSGIAYTSSSIVGRDDYVFASTLDSARYENCTEVHTIPVELVPGAATLPDMSPGNLLQCPVPEISLASRSLGLSNLFPDRDGVVRSHPLLVRFDDVIVPSTAFRLFMDVMGIGEDELRLQPGKRLHAGQYSFPVDTRGRLLLRFYPSQGGPFRELSYYDVLEGRVGESEIMFDGSLCIVGATAPGLKDAHPTPSAVSLPGPGIHTTLFANLTRGDYGTAMGNGLGFILTMVMGALAGVFAMQFRIARGSVYSALLLILFIASSYWIYWKWTYWLELFRPAMGFVLGYMAALLYRYRPYISSLR